VSRCVCKARPENGSTEHCAAVCHLFVLKSVTLPPQHMENFSRPQEMMQYQEHKPFTGTKCFLKAEPLLKLSSTVDHHRPGQVTTQYKYEKFVDLIKD
jgi:hypothetical protein